MKILLTTLNSKYIHTNLALKYLYESIYEKDLDVKLVEYTINHAEDDVFLEIFRGKYNIICFSCYIWNISETLNLANNIKKADPHCRIILGGPEVSFDTHELMGKHEFIDYVILSEGEKTFYELIDTFETGKNELSGIKGLAFRQNGKIIITEPRELSDINEIPFPYTHLAPEADRIIYYESSRGCPFNCSYCISSTTKGVRYLPMERVKRELIYFLERKVPQVKLVDRTFNSDRKRSIEMMKFLIDHDNGITNFHFEMAGDLLDKDLLFVLKSARKGLFQFEIGVQSTNDKVLMSCQRKSDFHSFKAKVDEILSYENTHLHLDLIAGLPYESFDSFKQSFDDVYQLKPHHFQLGFLKMLKGSKIREESDQYGYIFREKEPYEVIGNRFMSADDLIRLKMIETVLDLYYNKSGFRTTLSYIIEKNGTSPFEFYNDFAGFWYHKGYHHKSWKREDLYYIFKSYAEERKWGDCNMVDEVLKFDKYLASSRVIGKDRNDVNLNNTIHELLHNEAFVEKHLADAKGMKAKDIIKRVNFDSFRYNVFDFAIGRVAEIETRDNICIFNIEKKDLYEQAEVICIPLEEEQRNG